MPDARGFPVIIQGGMGVGVSNWQLARAVCERGQLGVVSGTALDTILVRRLQDGDHDGHVRRAMAAFPIPHVADDVLTRYFAPAGRTHGTAYALAPLYRHTVSIARQQLTMIANFVEVFLAKEGHDGVVGINLLTKVQMPNLASLYGAILADVDCVLMGAGIPRDIPAALDALANHQPARISFDVDGADGETPTHLTFDPQTHGGQALSPLRRPAFLAIVSSDALATNLARKASGSVEGFVVEGPTAGGHNAPPRGPLQLSATGEPIYGARDVVDLEKLRALGLPFWLAGGTGSPQQLQQAVADGARGVQVGTLFAYCDESGIDTALKHAVLSEALPQRLRITTDPLASPTGYPFKVVRWGETQDQSPARERVCDLGYLRTAYRRDDGRIGYRCPAEPVADYVQKGGDAADTEGRQCICNGLVATVGMPQICDVGREEPPLVTSGDDLKNIATFLGTRTRYTAADVVDYLLSSVTVSERADVVNASPPSVSTSATM